jgi:hypothetical protein
MPMDWAKIRKAGGKGLLWTFMVFIAGMLPAIIRLLLSTFATNHTPPTMEEMLKEGLLIGVLLALVGSVGIDWLFSQTQKVETLGQKLFFVVFLGFLIVVLAVANAALYVALLSNSLRTATAEFFCKGALLICALYCVVAKSFYFAAEKRGKNQ